MTTSRVVAIVALAALMIAGCEEPRAVPVVPAGAPQVICQGVPQAACRQAFDTIGAAPGSVAQVVVRCTLPVCTDANGDATVTIFFVDGRQETGSYGWASAPAMPAPVPVIPPKPLATEPGCVGIPLQACLEMATTGPEGNGVDATVGRITVRCGAVCTPASGQGQTTYDFVDGRPSVTVDWTYGNSG